MTQHSEIDQLTTRLMRYPDTRILFDLSLPNLMDVYVVDHRLVYTPGIQIYALTCPSGQRQVVFEFDQVIQHLLDYLFIDN